MKKIISKALAEQFVKAVLNDNKMIQLWDNMKNNRIMEITETISQDYFKVVFTDTVQGVIMGEETMKLSMLVEIIWENRKFINQSGQLDNL